MNYADEYAEHIKKFSCNHDQKRIVRQVVAGGAVQYVYQCIKCGARASSAMSKAAAIQLVGGDPVDFDVALKDRWESDRKRDLSDIEQRKKKKTTALRDECCPDFSCCGGTLMPEELRKRFVDAHTSGDNRTEHEILMMGLSGLLKDFNVHIAGDDPTEH